MMRALCVAAALVFVPASQAVAGFVNGVERFDGTELDTNTWEPFVFDLNTEEATIAQDDALTIDATPSGTFDNVRVLDAAAIPLPAAFWPAGAMLVSLAGIQAARRRRRLATT
jgi:hypothetical protein